MFVFVSELVLLDYSNIVYIYTHAHACVSPYVFTCVYKNLFHLVTCRKTDILPQLLDAKQPKRQCDVIKRRDASRQHQNDAIPLLSPPYKGCFIRKKKGSQLQFTGHGECCDLGRRVLPTSTSVSRYVEQIHTCA